MISYFSLEKRCCEVASSCRTTRLTITFLVGAESSLKARQGVKPNTEHAARRRDASQNERVTQSPAVDAVKYPVGVGPFNFPVRSNLALTAIRHGPVALIKPVPSACISLHRLPLRVSRSTTRRTGNPIL